MVDLDIQSCFGKTRSGLPSGTVFGCEDDETIRGMPGGGLGGFVSSSRIQFKYLTLSRIHLGGRRVRR